MTNVHELVKYCTKNFCWDLFLQFFFLNSYSGKLIFPKIFQLVVLKHRSFLFSVDFVYNFYGTKFVHHISIVFLLYINCFLSYFISMEPNLFIIYQLCSLIITHYLALWLFIIQYWNNKIFQRNIPHCIMPFLDAIAV